MGHKDGFKVKSACCSFKDLSLERADGETIFGNLLIYKTQWLKQKLVILKF